MLRHTMNMKEGDGQTLQPAELVQAQAAHHVRSYVGALNRLTVAKLQTVALMWPPLLLPAGQPEARQLQQQQQALPLPAPLPAGEPPLPSDAPPESATQLAPQRAEQHGRQRASSAPGGQAPSIPPPGYSQYMQVPPG